MSINPIVKEYDIRGRYPGEVNPEIARRFGAAFTRFLKRRSLPPTVVLGRDFRASSPALSRGLLEGILAEGGEAFDYGVMPYPELIYHALHDRGLGGAVMVTASHNPPEYNGFKVWTKAGEVAGDSGLPEIGRDLIKIQASRVSGLIAGKTHDHGHFVNALRKIVPEVPHMKILVDAAGGAAAPVLREILASYDLTYKPIFFEPDPEFKKHPPNPLDGVVDQIIRREKGGYDFRAVFDGDGDRTAFFDEKGSRIRPDIIFAILAGDILRRRPRSAFVFDSTGGSFLGPFLEVHGGRFSVSAVGHPHIRREMEKRKAVLGGEISGHVYHGDFHMIDCAILTMLKLLQALRHDSRKLSEIAGELTRAVMLQRRVRHANPLAALEKMRSRFSNEIVSELDGIRVQYPDWWFNMRASNTEPNLLRLTIEADSKENALAHAQELEKIIRRSP